LSDEQRTTWEALTERGYKKAKTYHPQWERSLERYAKPLTPKPGQGDEINALLDYRHVENRKAQLHFETPDVNLTPIDPTDPQQPIVQILPLREKVLNHTLGPDGADLQEAVDQTIVDATGASGWLVIKVGHEEVSLPDPVTGTPVPIWTRRFLTPISSKSVIVPDGFKSTRFDEAPFLAIKGRVPVSVGRRMQWLIPAGFEGTLSKDESHFSDGSDDQQATEGQLEYIEIWYKAHLYDPAVFNPELYRCLILVKGLDQPAWHVDSPYQSLDERGQLTDDSMIGNPIHMGVLRQMLDSAYVPSDLVVGEQLSTELNRFRTGLMRNRRGRRPVTLINDKAGVGLIEKVAANAGPIPTPEEYFDGAGGQRLLSIVQAGTEPRDNYTAQTIIEHDWQTGMGSGDNQGGQFSKQKTTATEVRTVQANSSARAKKDENRMRAWVVKLIRKFDAVLTRTATPSEIQKILGVQGAQLWEQWRQLPGQYAYHIQPDAGRYQDATEYRAQKVNEYNLFRKDPLVDPQELLTQVFTALGYDAGKIVRPPQPEKPEPVKISVTFNVEQAMAVPAEMKLLLAILTQQGYQIPPEIQAMLDAQAQLRAAVAQLVPEPGAEHGGSADRTEPINQHQTERTGGVTGVGRTM
jgi:hypothetical protein